MVLIDGMPDGIPLTGHDIPDVFVGVGGFEALTAPGSSIRCAVLLDTDLLPTCAEYSNFIGIVVSLTKKPSSNGFEAFKEAFALVLLPTNLEKAPVPARIKGTCQLVKIIIL